MQRWPVSSTHYERKPWLLSATTWIFVCAALMGGRVGCCLGLVSGSCLALRLSLWVLPWVWLGAVRKCLNIPMLQQTFAIVTHTICPQDRSAYPRPRQRPQSPTDVTCCSTCARSASVPSGSLKTPGAPAIGQTLFRVAEVVVVASIGQVWTRHLAPTAPAVTAFIAISVLPSVRLSICLSMRLTVLFPSSLNGARSMACWFWALTPGQGGGGVGGGGGKPSPPFERTATSLVPYAARSRQAPTLCAAITQLCHASYAVQGTWEYLHWYRVVLRKGNERGLPSMATGVLSGIPMGGSSDGPRHTGEQLDARRRAARVSQNAKHAAQKKEP